MVNFRGVKPGVCLFQKQYARAVLLGIAVTCAILVTSTQSAVADVTPPGVVIAHSFARTGVYLGSPAIAILPDGAYVVAHDTFGPGSRQNTESLYESRDEGRSWKKLVDVNGQYWSSLFVDHGLLYIVGTSGFSGLPCIRRSADGGRSWSVPRDIGTGMLSNEGKYFSAAVPVVVGNGRIWRSMESVEPTGIWSFMMSAPIDSNLLDGRNWKFTNRLRPNAEWLNGRFRGWLEGNAVVTSHDAVVNVLRVYFNDLPEKVALVSVSPDGTKATFDPESGFADMPGGGKKFTIRFDSRSGLYWSLTNSVDAGYGGSNYERARNTLALVASRDLRNWSIRRVVLHHNDWSNHGFQYADWQFDGNDIVAVVRTSFDDGDAGAHSQHDSNYITFNRIANFRDIGIEN